MVNTRQLKAAIAGKGFTQAEVATKIGISKASFNYKILNRHDFKLNEVKSLCDLLDISNDAMTAIFFAKTID